MNYELLIGLKPDVVLLYGIGDAQTAVTDKLKELSIPYLYMGEYLEESPLGKAEWMNVPSELTVKREKGIEIFREIPQRYYALKALTDSVSQRPTVGDQFKGSGHHLALTLLAENPDVFEGSGISTIKSHFLISFLR